MSRRLTGLFACTDKAKRTAGSVFCVFCFSCRPDPLANFESQNTVRRIWALLNDRYKLDEIKNGEVNNARSNDKHGSCRYSCVRGLGPLVGRHGLT